MQVDVADVLPPPRWTMSVALSRKRSRLGVDDDEEEEQQRREPSPAFSDTLKRSKTQCELEELDIIGASEAWGVDVDSILASRRIMKPGFEAHDNWARYRREESIVVLCVQGNVLVHYELLCAMLPDLYNVSPLLQAFVLCHDPATHELPPKAPFSLPLIQAVEPSNNHFVRLGLLHPLGGGKFPLDALVVLDQHGRRRLVLPFGWGAGKHAGTPAGRGIQTRLMELLRHCVETLERER
ncbi:hypothetical protein HBI80_055610 [Parastagonospora nodorum]|nr:hypothetical protein HBH43_126910 [Parastagonospora nodorum]KAH4908202.1 hypothetical protein HBI80_055610 [Parastagonospora nodorum]KAH6240743.1 hypothetical protein HBI15_012550 [Parastagonospora nodorum]